MEAILFLNRENIMFPKHFCYFFLYMRMQFLTIYYYFLHSFKQPSRLLGRSSEDMHAIDLVKTLKCVHFNYSEASLFPSQSSSLLTQNYYITHKRSVNMKVNIQVTVYANVFLAHLQGLKNPVLKLLSLQTENFALKQTHSFSMDQT